MNDSILCWSKPIDTNMIFTINPPPRFSSTKSSTSRWVAAIFLLGCVAGLPLSSMGAEMNQARAHHRRDPHPLLQPANPHLPSLFIIGDSTVRNGNGTGTGGQWGWGDWLAPYIRTNEINVVNDALGGMSSRTFYLYRWPAVKSMMKSGDFLIMQFGHNDASPINDTQRARGTIKGVGEETQEIDNLLTHRHEVVHTFGWYEKQMIDEARAKGATPMVCSLIPRNNWRNGQVARNRQDYAGWAGEVARAENVPFLDINEIIARRYDQLGEKKVKPLFIVGAGPHTSLAGAKLNAECVVAALKGLGVNPLAAYLSPEAATVAPADLSQPEPAPADAQPDKTTPETLP